MLGVFVIPLSLIIFTWGMFVGQIIYRKYIDKDERQNS